MKIQTRLKLTALAPLCLAVVAGIAIVFMNEARRMARHEREEVAQAIRSASDLSHLLALYTMRGEERPASQFVAEHRELGRRLAELHVRDADQLRLLGTIRDNVGVMHDMFERLVAMRQARSARAAGATASSFENRLAGQLLVRSRQVVADAIRLEGLVNQATAATLHGVTLLVLLLIVGVALPATVLLLRMMGTIGRTIARLHAGTKAVGAGDLAHRIELTGEDELADLARAFDQMTANLQAVTVSKAELDREVAERRRAEETLHTVVQHTPAAVCLIRGSDLRLQLANPAYQAFARERRMEGSTLDELWPETGRDFAALCRRVLETGEPHRAEDELNVIRRATDGVAEERYFSWSMHRVQLPGSDGWGLLNTAWETTPRVKAEAAVRESELFYRQTLESIPGMTFTTRPDGYCDYQSSQWVEYTGVPAAEHLGDGWNKLLHPDDRSRAFAAWQAAVRGRAPYDLEYRVRRRDGEHEWFRVMGRPIQDASGNIVRWFGVAMNIEALKRAEAALSQVNADLERKVNERTAKLQEMVGELEHFSYSITHDMRAPLRAMRCYAEMVTEECAQCDKEEPKGFLRRIVTAADRMDLLITDALNYNKAVRQELTLEWVDTDALLRGMLDTYPELQNTNADIRIDGAIPGVLGNRAGLTQCFSNLLGNAVKFAKPGQPPVIRLRADTRGEMVRIWVEDNGIGIPPSFQSRVFDMFSRGQRGHDGTGIGLALVRKVIERMGGRAGVASEEGVGSQFWLELRSGHSPMAAGSDGAAKMAGD